jgi:hypothetical protein
VSEQRARPAPEATNTDRPAPEATNRAHDVVAHLQSAALEMIAAARAFLDVAEELVKEPGEATVMAATLADLAGRIVPGGAGDHEQSPGVEHIRVS